MMVDVTDIYPVNRGDVVTLVGKDKDAEITVEEIAALAGTFNYEFVCDLGKRIPRNYYLNGQYIGSHDYFHELEVNNRLRSSGIYSIFIK